MFFGAFGTWLLWLAHGGGPYQSGFTNGWISVGFHYTDKTDRKPTPS
jgi:hypothetical protein